MLAREEGITIGEKIRDEFAQIEYIAIFYRL